MKIVIVERCVFCNFEREIVRPGYDRKSLAREMRQLEWSVVDFRMFVFGHSKSFVNDWKS